MYQSRQAESQYLRAEEQEDAPDGSNILMIVQILDSDNVSSVR